VWFAATQAISVQGSISTSGRGSTKGPGSPKNTSQTQGWGGSYGGSGGRKHCSGNVSFANVDYQIGSLLVLPDLLVNSTSNPTFGSAGVGKGSGQGGGRVVFNTTGVVNITGSVECNGGTASLSSGGSGSGGGIYVSASALLLSGEISATGGDGMYSSSGAGGGGRIAVNVSIAHHSHLVLILETLVVGTTF
jgi:hypothetical protein